MNARLLRHLVLLAAKEFDWTARLLSRTIRAEESSSNSWREQYARGDLDRLWAVRELSHHSVVAGYFAHFTPGGAVLDVGCGEGALQRHLLPHAYRRYLGIDVTPEAIRRAQRFADAKTAFENADAAIYLPSETFDTIVFNEVLYYFKDPVALLERYHACLAPSGVLIASNCLLRRSVRIPGEIRRRYDIEDEVSVINREGFLWVIQLARPRDRTPRASRLP